MSGLACAITLSAGYGSGVIPPGTGMWMNNCLGEMELNRRGLAGAPPGTRLPSNMAPTVARRNDGTILAIGSPGADRITTALLCTLTGYLELGLSLAEAVCHPRAHVEFYDGSPSRRLRSRHAGGGDGGSQTALRNAVDVLRRRRRRAVVAGGGIRRSPPIRAAPAAKPSADAHERAPRLARRRHRRDRRLLPRRAARRSTTTRRCTPSYAARSGAPPTKLTEHVVDYDRLADWLRPAARR